ncbi:transposase [Pseudarthrobacter siccitolerans]|uniref:transposase n=1 Tax=Pseudarthrobacter siccitolerans TaxID=861266 RepID=UPI00137925AB
MTWIASGRSIQRSCTCISTARPFPAPQGAQQYYKKFGVEPPDHAIGRSRGGLATKNHLVCDGKGRALAFVLTPGQTSDTIMLQATLAQIRVPEAVGRPCTKPERVMADKGYPSRANRTWLRERGTASTIPERDDQIAHRRKKRGRPIDFGEQQRQR